MYYKKKIKGKKDPKIERQARRFGPEEVERAWEKY